MPKHIGIVACTAEGAALCYLTICLEGAELLGKYAHPEVSMHTPSLNEYMKADDWNCIASLMLSSAEKLAKASADFIICPDNTIHQAFDLVVKKSPLPWLHIAAEVAREAARQKYRCLGILGTRCLMEGPVYPDELTKVGIKYKIPEVKDRKRINEIIFEELIKGHFKDESRAYFGKVIHWLKEQGCDAVVLGCTEIPLLVTQEHSTLPVLDSTRILARAALKEATETPSK